MELSELEAWPSKLQAQKDIVSGGGGGVDEVRVVFYLPTPIQEGVLQSMESAV